MIYTDIRTIIEYGQPLKQVADNNGFLKNN